MEILLVGRDTSITNTIKDMLISVESWSVTETFLIEETANKTSEDDLFDLIIANLADFTSPPTEIIGKIKDNFSSSYLLVFYSYNQKLLIEPLLNAGADGYLQNGVSEDELLEAVQTITDGKPYIAVESTY